MGRGNFDGKGMTCPIRPTFRRDLYKNGSTDRDAVWVMNSGAPKKALLHCESKKGATLIMAITLPILGGFAKFFHCWKDQ